MFLPSLAITAAAVCCVLSQTTEPEPAKCCTDHQFQGEVYTLGGQVFPVSGNVVYVDSYAYVAYDYYRKRVGMDFHLRFINGTEKVSQILVDYNAGQQYTYEDGVCTIAPMGEALESPCIPANATFLGKSQFGFGAEALPVNTWEYVKHTPDGDQVWKRVVTQVGCIPVVNAFYGTSDKVPTNAVEILTGFKPGIDDPSVLDIPSTTQCNFVSVQGNDQSQIVGRRKRSLFGNTFLV